MPHRPRGSRRLVQLVAIVAVTAVAAGAAACSAGEDDPEIAAGPTPTSDAQVPYDPSFAFKQRIPRGAALDPRSAAIARQLDQNSRAGKVFLSSRQVPPVYVVRRTDPFYSVTVGGETERFRVPAGAKEGEGADRPLVLLDPNHPDFGRHTELRLFKAGVDHEGRRLLSQGAGLFHYNNVGAARNPDGSPSISVPFAGQGTGSGLSILAGLIRPEEVRAGRIRHALRFAYSATDFTSGYRAPAIKTDQPKGTTTRNPATALEMGTRLQLDPAVDCSARTVPGSGERSRETRYLRMICRALQEYGMIAVDGTTERGILLMMEHTRTAGWGAIAGDERLGGYSHLIRTLRSAEDGLARGLNAGIPWDRFRALKNGAFPADATAKSPPAVQDAR